MDFLNNTFYENSMRNWLIAAGILVAVFLFLTLFKRIIKSRLVRLLEKSKTGIDDYMIPVLEQTRLATFFALGIYLGSLVLVFPRVSN